MADTHPTPGTPETIQQLRQAVEPFARADTRKSIWQLTTTFAAYAAVWALMCRLLHLGYPWWSLLPALVLAALLLVRIFIFFHDCTHCSLFASKRANRIVGYVTGVLAFTSYESWRRTHNIHHASYADLDRRGVGDIWTLTADEYAAAPRWRRVAYRLYRYPAVLLGPGPLSLFMLRQRLPQKGDRRFERASVYFTDLVIAALVVAACWTIGWRTYLLIQVPVMFVAGSAGVWLFYVQHQFEGVYWTRHEDWDPMKAALTGSSYYRLPRVLQWFTGSIGLHYIHHVQPRIPNYNLQRCLDATPILQTVKPLTLRTSLRSLHLNVWDESRHELVSFRDARATRP